MEPQLNVIFLPYPTPGHMIPMIDAARIFARHGVNATIITTQANAMAFQKAIDNDFNSGHPIKTRVIQFPASKVGLPEGVENIKDASTPELIQKIGLGIHMLKDQIEILFQDLQPDCLVTDMLYTWTVDSASKLGIPRIYFYSSSYFSTCASFSIRKHRPHEGLESDTMKFSIPGLPHRIEITALQIAEWIRTKNDSTGFFDAVFESERKSYGALYNSFHELEGDYEQHYKSIMGTKTWSIGPVSAWISKDDAEKISKGLKHDQHVEKPEWLKWLNSKQDESVLYVTFGSLTRLPHAQIVEIAHGLENSGLNFIWVIRKKDKINDDENNFLQDFEARIKENKRGYIIWNWAAQLLILDHPSIGGIVTHCGWNSILEGLNSGLPMITWPLFAEQFYNEKLVVDVLKVGVSVGAKENKFWARLCEEEKNVVKREEIVKAVVVLMGSGERSIEMRKRAKSLGDAGKKAIEEGGSSYNNLVQLILGLKSLKISRSLS